MSVSELLDQLDDAHGDVIGLMTPDGDVRAFVIKASPAVNDVIMQMTGQLPPAPAVT
jgi:hypothetical protein